MLGEKLRKMHITNIGFRENGLGHGFGEKGLGGEKSREISAKVKIPFLADIIGFSIVSIFPRYTIITFWPRVEDEYRRTG